MYKQSIYWTTPLQLYLILRVCMTMHTTWSWSFAPAFFSPLSVTWIRPRSPLIHPSCNIPSRALLQDHCAFCASYLVRPNRNIRFSVMERARRVISDSVAYEPLEDSVDDDTNPEHSQFQPRSRFSRLEYGVFFLLGVSMLWAW